MGLVAGSQFLIFSQQRFVLFLQSLCFILQLNVFTSQLLRSHGPLRFLDLEIVSNLSLSQFDVLLISLSLREFRFAGFSQLV